MSLTERELPTDVVEILKVPIPLPPSTSLIDTQQGTTGYRILVLAKHGVDGFGKLGARGFVDAASIKPKKSKDLEIKPNVRPVESWKFHP